MPLLLVLALVLVPIVELYFIVQVGQGIGVLPTLVLLVALSLLGGYLLRREGTRTWRAFRAALSAGRLPAAEVADGALVIFGGALLLTPGFATDAFGLLCVLPPSRAVLRRILTGLVATRLGAGGLLAQGVSGAASRRTSRSKRGSDVVEGEVVEPPSPQDPGPDTPRAAPP